MRVQKENETPEQTEKRLQMMQHNAREQRKCETIGQMGRDNRVCEQVRMRRKRVRVESPEDNTDPCQKATV